MSDVRPWWQDYAENPSRRGVPDRSSLRRYKQESCGTSKAEERQPCPDELVSGRADFVRWVLHEPPPQQAQAEVEMEGPSWDRTVVRKNLYLLAGPYRDLHRTELQMPKRCVVVKRRPPIKNMNAGPTEVWTIHDFRHDVLTDAERAVALPKEINKAMLSRHESRKFDTDNFILWKQVWKHRIDREFKRADKLADKILYIDTPFQPRRDATLRELRRRGLLDGKRGPVATPATPAPAPGKKGKGSKAFRAVLKR